MLRTACLTIYGKGGLFYKVSILFFSFKTVNQVIICEKVKRAITCPSGFTVNILSASYGRTSRAVCYHREHRKMSNTNCDSTEDIMAFCSVIARLQEARRAKSNRLMFCSRAIHVLVPTNT